VWALGDQRFRVRSPASDEEAAASPRLSDGRTSWPACNPPRASRLRDTGRAMSEEPMTRDLGEMTRQAIESVATRDWGVAMSFYGPDSVWDMSQLGLGTYRGVAAIRGVFEDWLGAYEEFEMSVEQVLTLNDGLTLAVVHQDGQPVGSSARVEIRYASVTEWTGSLIVRATSYSDIDEGRAAAERLAEGQR
jgi:ketosteroid isomerase-like protein